MANILIIDIDSRIPNLALKKIELYHIKRRDSIIWNMPLMKDWAEKIYISCVFSENREKAAFWEDMADIGGSGYNLAKKLPPEIEAMEPHINLGFTTRGCIRHCPFCIVPEKEGNIHAVGDLLDLWDGKSKLVTLLDNNLLALPEHFELVCQQGKANKLRIDFNQGLDHRLLTQEAIELVKPVKSGELRFAFDATAYKGTVGKAIDLLQANGIKRSFWYVLVGYNTNFGQDLERLDYLRDRGQTAFVQRYKKNRGNLLLGRWANRHAMFKSMSFGEYLSLPSNVNYRKRYTHEIDAYLGRS